MPEKNVGFPEKNPVSKVPLSARVEQSVKADELDEQINNRIKVFKQYDEFLSDAGIEFFMEKYPIADLKPDKFLKLLSAINESKTNTLPFYLHHAAYSNNNIIRYISVKYPHEDKLDTSKDGYDIFKTDLDVYKSDQYLEFLKKLEVFEKGLDELTAGNTGQKIFKLNSLEKMDFGKATPLEDWERWNIEDITDTVTTPDGRVYKLSPGERLILSPSKPEGEIKPEPFVVVNGAKIPFEEWAKNKEQKS